MNIEKISEIIDLVCIAILTLCSVALTGLAVYIIVDVILYIARETTK